MVAKAGDREVSDFLATKHKLSSKCNRRPGGCAPLRSKFWDIKGQVASKLSLSGWCLDATSSLLGTEWPTNPGFITVYRTKGLT